MLKYVEVEKVAAVGEFVKEPVVRHSVLQMDMFVSVSICSGITAAGNEDQKKKKKKRNQTQTLTKKIQRRKIQM